MKTIAPPSAKTAPVVPRTKQTSRKGTKSWRKNVDVTTEEAKLDDIREQERLGLGRVETKADDALFETDTKGDEEIRKREFGTRKLRVDEILKPKSGVLAVSSKVLKDEPARSKRQFSAAELARIERKQLAQKRTAKHKVPAKKETSLAIWDAPAEPETVSTENGEDFLPPKIEIKVPVTMREQPKAKVALPAVKVAPAGASYNPTHEDHQKLVQEAIREEEEAIAELQKIMARVPKDHDGGAMTIDLGEDDDEPASDAEASEAYVAPLTRKLTRAERNRQARRIAAEAVAARKRQEKEMASRVASLEQLQKDLERLEAERQDRLSEKRKRKAEKELAPLRGSKAHRYTAAPLALEVPLTEDLAGSLVGVKPEGHLLKDRFTSLQQRRLIEARGLAKHKRKFALKEYEKRDYREFQ
ncbi:hypothetical protein H9P43_002607 [Blastocladiella emersonii ATCC 22665]|nr:hypothetical protein H9P43_002607 [Blastocladiella emersonii ATCC 22665]